MAERVFVRGLQEGDRVLEHFLVRRREVLTTSAGAPYLALLLGDKTGAVDGKVWDDAEQYTSVFQEGDYIKVDAFVELYRGKLQLNIKRLRRSEREEVSPGDFLPVSDRPREDMLRELGEWVGSVADPHLGRLLRLFFDDEEFLERFAACPGAMTVHHAYIGGLLEHTLSVTRFCQYLAEQYAGTNRDLLVSMALLHDVGKTRELSWEPAFAYTDEGGLVGHIVLGLTMVKEGMKAVPDFPADLALVVEHMLISHQGELIYGAPKVPQTLEAAVLFYADNLDAKVQQVQAALAEVEGPSGWTAYHRRLERYLYKQGYSSPPPATGEGDAIELPPEASGQDEGE